MRSCIVLSLFVVACVASLEPNNCGTIETYTAKTIINPTTIEPVDIVSELRTGDVEQIGSYTQVNTVTPATRLTGTGLVVGSSDAIGTSEVVNTNGLEGANGIIQSNKLVDTGGELFGTSGGLLGSSTSSRRDNDVFGSNTIDFYPHSDEYSTKFYMFSAPEEDPEEEALIKEEVANMLKKQIRVFFVQAPEHNAVTNAALELAKQAIQTKTSIYILDKENDASQVVGQLEQIQDQASTAPEVMIVKYRTPDEAVNVKDQIRSQYESAGGTSQVIDGGIVPILNYKSPDTGVRSLLPVSKNVVEPTILPVATAEPSVIIPKTSTDPHLLPQVIGQLEQIQDQTFIAPEVMIVKYRTPDEPVNVKDQIRSQYESTGGTFQVIDRGAVPLLNYASPESGIRSLLPVSKNVVEPTILPVATGEPFVIFPKTSTDPHLLPQPLTAFLKPVT